MAHFAQLDDNNIVIYITVINNSILLDNDNVEQESLGIDFCKTLFGNDTRWVQTSYNNTFRYNYAGIGFTYDSINDAFIPPNTFDSWVLNTSTFKYNAPIPYPDNQLSYYWDESILNWVEHTIL
jgi:hypothetical protein